MKITTVKKYTCDFCKKKKYQRHAMEIHELHCTLNPNRVCRMCKMKDQQQPSLSELIISLPNIEDYWIEDHGSRQISDLFAPSMSEALKALRKSSGDCPACIMAALRQSKIPVPMVEGFDFTNECKAIWDEINAQNAEEDQALKDLLRLRGSL